MVSGGKTHFGIGEYEREETVLAPLFDDCEMAREYCELLNKVSNGVEGGIPHYCVNQECFHPPPYHFGDGGHFFRYCRHGCAVILLNKILQPNYNIFNKEK